MRKVAKVLLAVLAAGAAASAIILAVRCHKNRCKYGCCGCDDFYDYFNDEEGMDDGEE